jgi:5'-methylthioadenosine phosphorylase
VTSIAILTDTPVSGERADTPYGPSAPVAEVEIGGKHGLVCAPEADDPRATVRALKERGATHLWLCESVGALSPLLEPGDWLVPDDYIDGTRGQHYTYFSDKASGYVQQVPPFDPASREALLTGAASVTARPFRRGVYVCVSGTPLETPAEATFWTRAGGHVAGRFLSPYLTLARELEMQVAALVYVARAGGQPGQSAPFSVYERALAVALRVLSAEC